MRVSAWLPVAHLCLHGHDHTRKDLHTDVQTQTEYCRDATTDATACSRPASRRTASASARPPRRVVLGA